MLCAKYYFIVIFLINYYKQNLNSSFFKTKIKYLENFKILNFIRLHKLKSIFVVVYMYSHKLKPFPKFKIPLFEIFPSFGF